MSTKLAPYEKTSPTTSCLTTVAIDEDNLLGTRKHAIDFLVAEIPPLKRARILSDLSEATESFTNATKAGNNSSSSIFSLPPFVNSSRPSASPFNSTTTTTTTTTTATTPSPPFFPTMDSFIPPPPHPLSVASILPSTSPPQPPSHLFPSNPFEPNNSFIPIATGGASTKSYGASSPPSLFSSANFLLSNTTQTQLEKNAVTPEAKLAHVEKRCSECSYSSMDGEEMIAHAKAAHPNKPYACKVCARCFGEKGNMNKHYRTVHLKQRKHGCGKCGRFFAFADGLNRHISMVHLDRRPFVCDHCLCPTRPHSANIPCTHICGMRFKQKSHRRRHVRSVHQAHFIAD